MQQMRRSMVLALGALVLTASLGQAQEAITLGFYLVPKVGSGTFADLFRPKYVSDMTNIDGTPVQWSGMDLGIEPTFLIGVNLTAAQHTSLTSETDVVSIPDINTQVGGNPTLNRTRNDLEQRNIPGSWVIASTTWRQVVGTVGRNCLILQRLNGLHRTRLFPPGVSLDSTPDSVVFQQLRDVGSSFGLVVSGLSMGLTVRNNLSLLTSQMPAFVLANEVF